MHTLRQFLASLAFTVALGAVGSATAQVYPTRPITLIVPLAAGGPTDTLARIIAERMRVSLGQPLVIENVTVHDGLPGEMHETDPEHDLTPGRDAGGVHPVVGVA